MIEIYCRSCHIPIDPTDVFCRSCGADQRPPNQRAKQGQQSPLNNDLDRTQELPATVPAVQVTAITFAATAPQSNHMANCPACAHPVSTAAQSCPSCGHPFMVNRPQVPEQMLEDVAANMWRGIEAVGGRLQITTQRIVFRAHMFNLQTMPTEIPLDNVASAEPCNTMGIVPNGVRVVLKSGIEYRFVVWGRDRLIDVILNNVPKS